MSRRATAEKAWTQGTDPETMLDAIRSLIENENVAGARQLAAEAAAQFPDDPQIQRMHHFFRPRRVVPSSARIWTFLRLSTSLSSGPLRPKP